MDRKFLKVESLSLKMCLSRLETLKNKGYLMAVWQFVKDNFGTFWFLFMGIFFLVRTFFWLIRQLRYQKHDDQYIP